MPYRTPLMDALEPRRFCDSLTAGVTANTVVSMARPNRNWTISLTKGQAIYLAAGETGGASAFQTQLILIAPNRKAIARSVGDSGAFVGKVAPVSGTYTVRVRDTSGTNRSGVKITAFYTGSQVVTDNDGEGDPVGLADSGRRYPATISPGDLDVWRIDGSNPGLLQIILNENDRNSAVGVGVALIGPDGKGLRAGESDAGVTVGAITKASGTYYAVVYEPGGNASGRYGISFARVPGRQTTEDPDTQQTLVPGTARNGDLPAGDVDVFAVTVSKGQQFGVSVARRNGTTTPFVGLIDPSGNDISLRNDNGDGNVPDDSWDDTYAYAAATGTYYVVLSNATPSTGGGYRLTFQRGPA